MAAFRTSQSIFRRLSNRLTQRREMASNHEPDVTWSQYRSGDKTLSEWVDSNRARVAFGFFVFYSSLAAWNLRPRSKPSKSIQHEKVETEPSA